MITKIEKPINDNYGLNFIKKNPNSNNKIFVDFSSLNFKPKFICIAGENGTGKSAIIHHYRQISQNQKSNSLSVEDQPKLNAKNTINIDPWEINQPPYEQKYINDRDISTTTTISQNSNFGVYRRRTIDGGYYYKDALSNDYIVDNFHKLINSNCVQFVKENKDKNEFNFSAEFNKTKIQKLTEILNDFLPNLKIDFYADKWFNNEYDIHTISSGEQQVLFLSLKIFEKLDALSERGEIGDEIYIFIDEIEVFLHPNWQHKILLILKKVVEIFIDKYQFIFTTHSHEIVESTLINNELCDSSIVIHLQRENNNVSCDDFYTKDDIKTGTICEINYKIFGMPNMEYFLCLYEYKIRSLFNGAEDYNGMEAKIKIKLPTNINNLVVNDVQIDPNYQANIYNGAQTFVTRMRHLIAHGVNINSECNYKWYANNIDTALVNNDTKSFYKNWEDKQKRTDLLKSGIEILQSIT